MTDGKCDPEVPTSVPASPPVQNDTTNPFIRFKRFADTQAGLVAKGMHSIINLPTTLSKPPPPIPEHSRWTDWDEHLKRRDEAQAQRRLIKDSRDAETQTYDNDKEAGGASSTDLDTETGCPFSKEERAKVIMDDEGESDGLELYMPVTRAIFGHLIEELDERTFNSPFGAHSAHHLPKFMDFLRQDGTNALDHMPVVQAKIFDRMNEAPCPIKKLSTIPYLMFSPYSPLALTFQMPVQSLGSRVQGSHETFPYAAAFQDLLLISQGREMKNIEDMALTKGMHGFWHSWTSSPGTDDRVSSAMSWLGEMTRVGLLWTKVDASWFEHNKTKPWVAPESLWASSTAREDEGMDGKPVTELDVFDVILKALNGHLPSESEVNSMMASVQKDLNRTEQNIRSVFPSSTSRGPQSDDESFTDSIISQALNMLNAFREIVDGSKTPASDTHETKVISQNKDEEAEKVFAILRDALEFQNPEEKPMTPKSLPMVAQAAVTSDYSEQRTTREADGTICVEHEEQATNDDGSVTTFKRTARNYPDGTSSLTEYEVQKLDGKVIEEDSTEFYPDGTYVSNTSQYVSNSDGTVTIRRTDSFEYPDGSSNSSETMFTRAPFSDGEISESRTVSVSLNSKTGDSIEKVNEIDAEGIVLDKAPPRSEILQRLKESEEQSSEVTAWEEEGRRIKAEIAKKEASEKERVKARRALGRGWFWE